MSIEDTIGFRNGAAACIVCGKNVEHGGGFARIKRGNAMLELCCPLCLETFQGDPEPHLKRLYRADYFRELALLQNPGSVK
jgi:ribosomal protein L24E